MNPWTLAYDPLRHDPPPRDKLRSAGQPRKALLDLAEHEDPNVHLEHASGDVSLRDGLGRIVFTKARGKPPHVSASTGAAGAGEIEFLVGGTRTPVPADRGLPMETRRGGHDLVRAGSRTS